MLERINAARAAHGLPPLAESAALAQAARDHAADLSLLFLAWARWAPMDPLFDDPQSTVLLDRKGELLAASVATDGQWRMPAGDTLPERFVRCLLEFEDRHFYAHWGIHLPSLIRAAQQNRCRTC